MSSCLILVEKNSTTYQERLERKFYNQNRKRDFFALFNILQMFKLFCRFELIFFILILFLKAFQNFFLINLKMNK
jgi:hypothetical protein